MVCSFELQTIWLTFPMGADLLLHYSINWQ